VIISSHTVIFILGNYPRYTLKMLGYFNPTFGSNMDKPKRWVKNVIKMSFNPMAGFVHIWPKVGLKQPSILLSVHIVTIHGTYCCIFVLQYIVTPLKCRDLEMVKLFLTWHSWHAKKCIAKKELPESDF